MCIGKGTSQRLRQMRELGEVCMVVQLEQTARMKSSTMLFSQ